MQDIQDSLTTLLIWVVVWVILGVIILVGGRRN